ncbi:MAG: hypothetical protein LBP33_08450 [Candidatus Adiutrix sp.]|jgi:MraZ protein|nr:hypothetical protein [Candidatus Adiutrix sp.]
MSERFSFMNTYTHTLDDKGRLALPGRFRDELQKSERPDEVVALPNQEGGYLTLYPHEHWQKVEADLRAIEDTDERETALEYFVGNSDRLTLDKNGRLLISPRFRELTGLDKEVDVAGLSFKIKIRPSRKNTAGQVEVPQPKAPDAATVKKIFL